MRLFHTTKTFCAGSGGQLLIEAMIALGIIVIGLLGLLNLLSNSLGLNKVIADQYAASYLAAEGIEVMKSIIDIEQKESGEFGVLLNGSYELTYLSLLPTFVDPDHARFLKFDPTTKHYSYEGSEETPFKRVITIRRGENDNNEIIVESVVEWTTRGNITSRIRLEDHFFNWRG